MDTTNPGNGKGEGETEPVSPVDAQRLLVVVAHPDDETFGCGSLLAHAFRAGMTTAVWCATRGEAGEAIGAIAPGQLGAVREAETRAAADLLGVSEVDFGAFTDSSMSGVTPPATLVGAPLAEVIAAVRSRIETFRPSIVVTLDAGDGHRDHARIRDATVEAVAQAEHPVERLYLHGLARSLMRRWVDHIASTDPSWEHLRNDVPGTPDELISTVIDTSAELDVREAAMRLHASQRSPFDNIPDALRRDFLTSERLRRLRPTWTGGPVETSLVGSR